MNLDQRTAEKLLRDNQIELGDDPRTAVEVVRDMAGRGFLLIELSDDEV